MISIVVHAVAHGVGTAFVIVERLIAEVLVVVDAQALEEAFSCFEVVAQVEGVVCALAAQDESAAALTRQNSKEIGK